MKPQVTIVIVTFNSRQYLAECLDSICQQTFRSCELIVIDNASEDGTEEILGRVGLGRVVRNSRNIGFSAAQNQGIKMGSGKWVLTLNPDVVLAPDFLETLVLSGEAHGHAGTVCGKLLRWKPLSVNQFSNVIDSTGIYFHPDLRHLDRGSGELDSGQYNRPEYVFGATGAAALYRRSMIEDLSDGDEFFDEDFFAYREDADVAWRAQLKGWKCLYIPEARGWHVRRVTPERRKELPEEINWHSVKNRFLMRMKNAGARLLLRVLPRMLVRDVLIVGYAVLVDRKLLSALVYPIRNWRRIWRKRRSIQSRRLVSDRDLLKWFNYHPTSAPVEKDIVLGQRLKVS